MLAAQRGREPAGDKPVDDLHPLDMAGGRHQFQKHAVEGQRPVGLPCLLNRSPGARSRSDEAVGKRVKASFVASDRTYGARRVWRDLLAEGVNCGLHRIERLMRLQALRARPRRRRLPKDEGDRQIATVPSNILDRQFAAERPNQKWIADFTYIWTIFYFVFAFSPSLD
jgi:transposase InsO family protein